MGIVVYFPAVAPPLASAGVDDERNKTPAPSEDVARKFATAVRRSMDFVCSLFAMAFLGETEYASTVVVLVDERNVKRMTDTAARKKRNIMMIAILDTVDE
jgi:hypothetical protein